MSLFPKFSNFREINIKKYESFNQEHQCNVLQLKPFLALKCMQFDIIRQKMSCSKGKCLLSPACLLSSSFIQKDFREFLKFEKESKCGCVVILCSLPNWMIILFKKKILILFTSVEYYLASISMSY